MKFFKRLRILSLLKSIIDIFRSLFNPYLNRISCELRIKHLRLTLQSLDWENLDIYIIGRSAGAIVASRLALEFPVKAIIALGYPFIHPKYGMQAYRVKHLVSMDKPLHILQGVQDEYGNQERVTNIPMSACVQIIQINTDHGFDLDDATWEVFTSQFASIIMA